MTVHPFGMWQTSDEFYQAVDLEDEQDDQYEEEDEQQEQKYHIISLITEQADLHADTLVLAVGLAATAFVDMFVDIPAQAVAEVNDNNTTTATERSESRSTSSTKKQRCLLYRINNGTILCQCTSTVPPEHTHAWVKLLVNEVSPKNIIVLASQTKTSFHGDVDAKHSDADVMRCLRTTTPTPTTTTTSIAKLEHGTVVSGLAAAVVSYCEVMGVDATLYMSFTESHFVDVFTLKNFQVVLGEPVLKDCLPLVPKTVVTQKLKGFEGLGVADNNLYI